MNMNEPQRMGHSSPGGLWWHAHRQRIQEYSWVQLKQTGGETAFWIVISEKPPKQSNGPQRHESGSRTSTESFWMLYFGLQNKAADKQTLGIISNFHTRVNKDGNGAVASEPAAQTCHNVTRRIITLRVNISCLFLPLSAWKTGLKSWVEN